MFATTIVNENDQKMYYVSPLGISVMGKTKVYETYQQMISEPNPPSFAWCLDATGDKTVDIGAAFYVYKDGHYQKLYESEAMDNVIHGGSISGKPEGYDDLVLTVDNLKERVESLEESTVLNDHIANTDIHITVDERNAWNNKVDKEEGKGLSSNDFTNEYISKIADTEAAVIRLDQSKMSLEDGLDIQNRISYVEQDINSLAHNQQVINNTVITNNTINTEEHTLINEKLNTHTEQIEKLLQSSGGIDLDEIRELININAANIQTLNEEVLGSKVIVNEIDSMV